MINGLFPNGSTHVDTTPDHGGGGSPRRSVFRRFGDFLIFVTGGVPRLIGGTHERHRFVTLGALMLLTAGMAVYSAASVAAMGLSLPVVTMLPVGLFFAAFVLMIDRSIVSHVSPLQEIPHQKPGSAPPAPADHPTPALVKTARTRSAATWVRVGIAVIASLLISEVLLLQIFSFRIGEQLALDKAAAADLRDKQVAVPYERKIKELQAAVDTRQKAVTKLEKAYDRATKEANCQLTGKCEGYDAGPGDLYKAALARQKTLEKKVSRAQDALETLRGENKRQISTLRAEQRKKAKEVSGLTEGGYDLLDRERAFLEITAKNGEVLVWRILLTLLLLGVDLAPVLLKATLKHTVHDQRVRSDQLEQIDREMVLLNGKIVRHRGDGEVTLQAIAYEHARKHAWLEAQHELVKVTIKEWLRVQKQNPPSFRSPVNLSTPTAPLWSDGNVGADHGPRSPRRPDPGHQVFHQPSVPDGHDHTPIMVLNDRWCVYESLNADSSDMAGLYKAYELANPGRTVVAKVFHQAQNDPKRFRTFLREVRGMRLSNPHIGEIIDSGQDRKSKAVYLVSPLYRPGSLNLYVQRQLGAGVPLKWSLWVLDQVLAGLEAAGMSNIIHLDIKPQNIVLDGPSNVRIIDWGMSQLHEAGQSVSTVFPGGTKWFASPEQLGDGDATPNSLSDLYGVGALAYWLLTGMPPLRREVGADANGDILQARRLMEAGVRPERVDRLVPGLPRELGELVDRWLSHRPADRAPEGLTPTAALGWARQRLNETLGVVPDMRVGLTVHRRADEAAEAGRREANEAQAPRIVPEDRLVATGLPSQPVDSVGFVGSDTSDGLAVPDGSGGVDGSGTSSGLGDFGGLGGLGGEQGESPSN
ncbi:DUF4407 domain-containing protein [Streptosporangium carneum]|uniref:non-specific serine/threonine protein kinase n=1 Tax=Streptosporangium carneum TaxID=47481 RepID=A0A9W6HX63_9ACTN|nr:DUF4407 domain-containing protein [Streptosporangium carneum]GLK07009.1 hypothetical protein GCM10017600_04140 [Streptosporangium carneum]